jgi:hypothetical protein
MALGTATNHRALQEVALFPSQPPSVSRLSPIPPIVNCNNGNNRLFLNISLKIKDKFHKYAWSRGEKCITIKITSCFNIILGVLGMHIVHGS